MSSKSFNMNGMFNADALMRRFVKLVEIKLSRHCGEHADGQLVNLSVVDRVCHDVISR